MPELQLEYPPMPDVGAISRHRQFQETASYSSVHDMGDVQGDIVVDLRRRNVQKMRLVGNITSVTIVDPPGSGNSRLWIYQDGGGGHTIADWDPRLDWGGTAPVMPAGADKFCIVVLEYNGEGVYVPQMVTGVDGIGFDSAGP